MFTMSQIEKVKAFKHTSFATAASQFSNFALTCFMQFLHETVIISVNSIKLLVSERRHQVFTIV